MSDNPDIFPEATPAAQDANRQPPDDGSPGGPPPAKKAAKKAPAKKAPAKKAAKKAVEQPDTEPALAKKAPAKKATKKAATKKAAKEPASPPAAGPDESGPQQQPPTTAKKAAKRAAKAPTKKAAEAETSGDSEASEPGEGARPAKRGAPKVLFQAPETTDQPAPARKRATKAAAKPAADDQSGAEQGEAPAQGSDSDEADEGDSPKRRPRRRGGRRRRKAGDDTAEGSGSESEQDDKGDESTESDKASGGDDDGGSRRRRTRNRSTKGDKSADKGSGKSDKGSERSPEDEIASVTGSTRLEAKKQRRREGREAGRRRAPIVSEAEFLARRESVDRVMVIRQRDDLTQIGVLEDKVLVEHYVSRASQTSMIGNVYLGRVQNVLPSMEAAFIDIGKGRNAVLYAGEVNWSALGHKDGAPRKIESVLSSGQPILVQVTKDPIGHKGARLTSQISLPGRFLVYVPDGNSSGISRKLPDTERNRLKTLLKEIVPDSASVIVRTAAEGASEDELTRDVERLTARWSDIEVKIKDGQAPNLLYGEPDLTLKVVRDLFTEDFAKLVVQGDDAWDLVDNYVAHVAPDLRDRLERYQPDAAGKGSADLFAAYRVDEQIAKGLDRKVWLPSGGSLVIDRTEAMTVVDVNTGKFTGSGGNLEETVTKNNLEAAEEIVRQLRLRDIGGIIVVDFIDMVLESNRDLVLRRLVECLGRDRTRHQVAEVTSLGLVQMTRKRIGTGLLEAFSEECPQCKGRGVLVHEHPVETAGASAADDGGRGRRSRGGRSRGGKPDAAERSEPARPPSPADLAGTKPHPEPETSAESEPLEAADTAHLPEVEPSAVEETEPTTVEETESVESETEPTPAEPVPPTVVTTTRRRRTASRPAGPPAGVAPSEAAPQDAAPQPKGSEAETHESGDTDTPADPEPEVTVLHVPVKKKGTRKR